MSENHFLNLQYPWLSGKCKLKLLWDFLLPQLLWDFLLPQLTWLKRKQVMTSAGMNVGKGNTQLPLEEVQCSATIMEISMEMP